MVRQVEAARSTRRRRKETGPFSTRDEVNRSLAHCDDDGADGVVRTVGV